MGLDRVEESSRQSLQLVGYLECQEIYGRDSPAPVLHVGMGQMMRRSALVEHVYAVVAECENACHTQLASILTSSDRRHGDGGGDAVISGPAAGSAESTPGQSRLVAGAATASACYFRSGPEPGRRKALLKITDRCDLRCSHCFVSATAAGEDMSAAALRGAIGRLLAARVANVTITGGEPLLHPELPAILSDLVGAGLSVTVCTNGVSLDDDVICHAAALGRVSFNVSLDGARAESHGKFRGDASSFERTVANIRRLAEAGLLKGILCTPNNMAEPAEYTEILELASEAGASYFLLNPLSSFGRGIPNRRFAVDQRGMRVIRDRLELASGPDSPERALIRFPNSSKPLTGCIAGDILYVFVDGDITVCPYLVFATENPDAQHRAEEFIVGNLFEDPDIVERIERYDFHSRYKVGDNDTCSGCSHNAECGKGCPAAVIAAGGRIGDLDAEVCPVGDRATPVEIRAVQPFGRSGESYAAVGDRATPVEIRVRSG